MRPDRAKGGQEGQRGANGGGSYLFSLKHVVLGLLHCGPNESQLVGTFPGLHISQDDVIHMHTTVGHYPA